MNPHFFFEGTIREEAGSAFLATLLEQDPGFRAAFVRRVGGGEAGEHGRARVHVEHFLGDGLWADIVLEVPGLVILVENKVRAGAIRPRQLVAYHGAAVRRWPRCRVIAVHLAPEASWGWTEARMVRREARRLGRDDLAAAIGWNHVRWLLRFATTPDPAFRRGGMRAIELALAKVRPPSR